MHRGNERQKIYGARYLDPKYSRWISTDPALGEYIPGAPINEEAKRHNQNLPGMGGVFNTLNASLYHYAGNNPVKYTDPDGKKITKLSDDKWNDVKRNLDNLVEKLNTLIGKIDSCDGDVSKLDSRILESAKTYLTSEFGNLPLDLPVLGEILNHQKEHLESLDRDDFRYDDKTDAYGYTFIFFKDIYLGDLFFNAKDSGGFDTKEGTILHESTHYFWGLGTKDWTYYKDKMLKLPDDGIFKSKQNNANNWEYFYESIVE